MLLLRWLAQLQTQVMFGPNRPTRGEKRWETYVTLERRRHLNVNFGSVCGNWTDERFVLTLTTDCSMNPPLSVLKNETETNPQLWTCYFQDAEYVKLSGAAKDERFITHRSEWRWFLMPWSLKEAEQMLIVPSPPGRIKPLTPTVMVPCSAHGSLWKQGRLILIKACEFKKTPTLAAAQRAQRQTNGWMRGLSERKGHSGHVRVRPSRFQWGVDGTLRRPAEQSATRLSAVSRSTT